MSDITCVLSLKKRLERALERLPRGSDLHPFYGSLVLAVEHGCNVKLPRRKRNPGLRQIRQEIHNGAALVFLVSGAQYYRVNESWYHYVALLPKGGGFRVSDPYSEREFRDYIDWDSRLATIL